ncbi:hypothetical protein ACJX0J_010189 [Zea mays]
MLSYIVIFSCIRPLQNQTPYLILAPITKFRLTTVEKERLNMFYNIQISGNQHVKAKQDSFGVSNVIVQHYCGFKTHHFELLTKNIRIHHVGALTGLQRIICLSIFFLQSFLFT